MNRRAFLGAVLLRGRGRVRNQGVPGAPRPCAKMDEKKRRRHCAFEISGGTADRVSEEILKKLEEEEAKVAEVRNVATSSVRRRRTSIRVVYA